MIAELSSVVQLQRGLTLLECLVVNGVLVLVSLMVGLGILGQLEDAQHSTARLQLKKTIISALGHYEATGHYPERVEDQGSLDLWGRRYVRALNRDDTHSLLIVLSAGDDGEVGTEDDLSAEIHHFSEPTIVRSAKFP